MLKKAETVAEEARAKTLEATRVARRELEALPDPLPPIKNSNDFIITDMEKPTALYLFNEDYGLDNQVRFVGRFAGRWTAKVQSALSVGGNYAAPQFSIVDEAQLAGPVGRLGLLAKFRPGSVLAQLDLGHHLLVRRAELGHARLHLFLNPFVCVETDRKLAKPLFGFGFMTYINRFYRDHWRFSLLRDDQGANWKVEWNMLARHRGFYLNTLLGLTTRSLEAAAQSGRALFFDHRKILLGYDRDDFNLNAELFTKTGAASDWGINNIGLSMSYDLHSNGLVGLYATRGVQSLKTLPIDVAAVKVDDLAFGYRNKLRTDFELKTKFGLRGWTNLFLNYRVSPRLNVLTSLGFNALQPDHKGFLDLPFDFGLKFKYET